MDEIPKKKVDDDSSKNIQLSPVKKKRNTTVEVKKYSFDLKDRVQKGKQFNQNNCINISDFQF